LLVHLLFVMLLKVTPLREVAAEVAQVIHGEPAPHLFDDATQGAPQPDPFGARAELSGVERPAQAELTRQAPAPTETKLAPEMPLDLPAPVVRMQPPERVPL